MPRYSVVLPTHNRADVLPFAIDSVLNQTESDFELFVVGDGCTDSTADIVAQYDDVRIRWLGLPKAPGIGYANRNIALRQATGELIAYAAHDDLLFPDHLERLGALFADEAVDWAYGMALWPMPNGLVVPATGNLNFEDERKVFLTTANFIASTCVVHRRSCLERFGYWPENGVQGGDWDLWKRIVSGGHARNFAYLQVPTALHFRANWRKSGIPEHDDLAGFAERSDWWPSALRIDLQGRVEQGVFARLLEQEQGGWVAAARLAVTTLTGRVLRDYVGLRAQARWNAEHVDSLRNIVASLKEMLDQRDLALAAALKGARGSAEALASMIEKIEKTPPAGFDEKAYLELNADIANAVGADRLSSGFEHWRKYGVKEGRRIKR